MDKLRTRLKKQPTGWPHFSTLPQVQICCNTQAPPVEMPGDRRPNGQRRTVHENYVRHLLELASAVMDNPDGWEPGTKEKLLYDIDICLYGETTRPKLKGRRGSRPKSS